MALGQMRQTIFNDQNLSLFQQSISDQFSQVASVPFMNGNRIDSISLVTGQENVIDHKLGRKASGYFILSLLSNATVWNDSFSGDTTITLRCSSDTTVSIWVF